MPIVGNAALMVTAPSGATYTYRLAHPLAFQLAPGHRTNRYVRDSLDFSARDVIAIGSGRMELDAMLRFERTSRDLLDVLAYAADGRTVTYVPDLAGATSYDLRLVNAAELVELVQDPERYNYGEYQVRARFRDAAATAVSLEELYAPWLFRFTGGVPGRFSTFTRTGSPSNAWAPGRDGIYQQVASGLPGIGFVESAGVLVPAYIGNPAATNLVLDSADIDPDDANWNESTAWTQAAAVALFSGKTSQRFTNNGTGNHSVIGQVIVLAASPYVASVIIEEGTADYFMFGIYDEVAALWVNLAEYTWATGALSTLDSNAGTAVGVRACTLRAKGPNGGKLVRLEAYGTPSNAGNNGRLYIYPDGGRTTSDYVYLHHAQYETGTVATAPIVTDGSTKTRNDELISIPVPRGIVPMAILAEVVEWGSGFLENARLWSITNGSDANPRLLLYASAPGTFYIHYQTASAVSVDRTVTPGQVGGDRLRILALLYSDGSVQIGCQIGSGAVTMSTRSSAIGLPREWAAGTLYVSGNSSARGVSPIVGIVGAPGTDWTLAQVAELLRA
ncbi:MAG: hypothetical protein OEW52_00090 [Thermoleophilia bacterium]|nr:hypothetical protein [Thermoleophilia bacterium]